MIPASATNANKPSVVLARTLWLYHHVTNTQYDNAIQLGFVTAEDAVSAYYRPKQDGVFLDWQRFTLTAVVQPLFF